MPNQYQLGEAETSPWSSWGDAGDAMTTPHLLDEKNCIFFHSLYFMCAICFISETEVSEFFGRMDELILRRLSFHHMWRGVYFHTRTHTCASICSCHNIDHAVLVCPLAIRTAKLLCYVFCICGVGNKLRAS